MLRTSAVAVTALAIAEAFAPTPLPLRNSLRTSGRLLPLLFRSCRICLPHNHAGCLSSLNMQFNGKPIDRKDGFGGGAKAIFETIEKRSKDDWSGSGTGGASGKIPTGPASFEEYMKKRAAESGGKVLRSEDAHGRMTFGFDRLPIWLETTSPLRSHRTKCRREHGGHPRIWRRRRILSHGSTSL